MPGSNQPLSCSQHESISEALFHLSTQPLGTQCETSGHTVLLSHPDSVCAMQGKWRVLFPSATQSLGVYSGNHPQGEFLTKQLPAQAQGFSHSPTFQPVQRLSKSESHRAKLLPSPGVTWHLNFSGPASTVPVDVYCFCVSPTLSLFPPATSSIQVPPGAGLPSLLW